MATTTIPVPDSGRKLIASPRHTVGLLLIQLGLAAGGAYLQSRPSAGPNLARAQRNCAALCFHDRSGMGTGEVKGTQTLGKTLILTRGEVPHITSHAHQCILVLVHSVKVFLNNSGNGKVRVSGGNTEVKESWTLRPADLSPIQYSWTVN